MRAAALSICALVAAVALGCGGGGSSGGDREQIRTVIRLSLTTEDVGADCRERLSERFVERTYLTRDRCVRIQRRTENHPARSVTTSDIRIRGRRASARIAVHGGEADGERGVLFLVRENGDWRIDDLSVALLRSLIDRGLRHGTKGLPPGGASCISRALHRLPDAQLRPVGYALIGQTPAAQRRLLELLAGCRGSGGASLLRSALERGIVRSLRQRGVDPATVGCVIRALRARIPDRELPQVAGAAGQALLARQLAPALRECASQQRGTA